MKHTRNPDKKPQGTPMPGAVLYPPPQVNNVAMRPGNGQAMAQPPAPLYPHHGATPPTRDNGGRPPPQGKKPTRRAAMGESRGLFNPDLLGRGLCVNPTAPTPRMAPIRCQ